MLLFSHDTVRILIHACYFLEPSVYLHTTPLEWCVVGHAIHTYTLLVYMVSSSGVFAQVNELTNMCIICII